MWNLGKRLWKGGGRESRHAFFTFDRPLVILQSDDWGRVGVRDREGYESLRQQGIQLGQHPYDFYTLETACDVTALMALLRRHRDSVHRPPSMVMNFLLANLDFPRMTACDFQEISLLFLSHGLPGHWRRPKLFDSYREGIAQGVFYPALHGLTHFCRAAAEAALLNHGKRGELLRSLWQAETPFIYWRMPWIGYEYHNPDKPNPGFLSAETQQLLIRRAAEEFRKFFSCPPRSACAPGYRANEMTHQAWCECGVRVAQNGSGAPRHPHFDDCGVLNLYRTIDIEPSSRELSIEKYVQLAAGNFARGIPAVVSMHSINFHSSLKDFRTPSIRVLDEFLSALEALHPDLLYVNDEDVYRIVTEGKFEAAGETVSIRCQQHDADAATARTR
ncbi:MAG TPA: hypothetical protein VFA68_07810 [Terriglobales bacterium]|nr:hypothetical protein [Terriglobales bacterium]